MSKGLGVEAMPEQQLKKQVLKGQARHLLLFLNEIKFRQVGYHQSDEEIKMAAATKNQHRGRCIRNPKFNANHCSD